MPPEMKFICKNPECVWNGVTRQVSYQVVGVGLYARPTPVVCECNFEVFLNRVKDVELE